MDRHESAPARHTTILIFLVIAGSSAGLLLLVLFMYLVKKYSCKVSCCYDSVSSCDSQVDNKGAKQFYATLDPDECWTPDSGRSSDFSTTRESIDKYKDASLYIPGTVATETVQPRNKKTSASTEAIDASSQSEARSRSGSLLHPQEAREGPYFFEYPQLYSQLYDQNLTSELNPGDDAASPNAFALPSPCRRKSSEPPLRLGSISIQLHYAEHSSRSLVLTLQSIQNIAFPRPEIDGVYASIQLTPVREYRHVSKQLYRNARLTFNEEFHFTSGPSQRDFGSRTILITVICVEKSSKHSNYGEARIPLLNREIFSQVPANLQLPIQPMSLHNEIGDAEISLSFSHHKSLLSVQVNCIRFPTARALENITDLRIKSYLDTIRDKVRHGKTQTMVKEIPEKTMEVEFSHQLLFELSSEDFPESILKFRIQGRQKFTRRIISIGKIQIGQHVPQGGSHWRVIQNQNDIGWMMWHPIYTY